MSETALVKDLMLRASEAGNRLFRNNVGMGWAPAGAGRNIIVHKGKGQRTVTMNPGDVLVRKARPLHAGLAKGSTDLIGWRRVQISENMVGRTIAQFLAPEAKMKHGRIREEQKNFMELVQSHGGRSGVVRSIDELNTLMEAELGTSI